MISKEQLLAEIEDIIRTTPPQATIRHSTAENHAWLGRAAAVLESWNPDKSEGVSAWLGDSTNALAHIANVALRKLMMLLNQARHDLRMQIPGAGNVAVEHGAVFCYFDEIRKIVELARQDVLFVDPYLESEFVSRYLPQIAVGVSIRLLTKGMLSALLPAADAFAKQTGANIAIRSTATLHDRYVFVDGISCFQSGASFKDGAKSAPTTLTQIMDAFDAVRKTYEDMWAAAKVER